MCFQRGKLKGQQRDTSVKFATLSSSLYSHSMGMFLVRRQLQKIMLRCMRRLERIVFSHSSCVIVSLYKITLCLYSAPQGQTWQRRPTSTGKSWRGKKLQVWAQYFLFLVTRAGLWCCSAHWKQFQIWKETFLYLKMYIKWCQQHPGGHSRVPMETESGCGARRLDTPPSLSGGSVMALSFSRHVPGSFDTGNMHADWQWLGCAAETMMYISFSSLTDWRL